ncbi:purine nucleosidase/pyrimidine-specific ribonucleoside hydrolase [Agromyces flavus]|uniref:Pyrimidine-specific ribonucleoside hydrolase n=1 Tax=Agromyces flavus TaxID=589382 RepID=A0A1H1ZI85_9MICO|nr:nucleoside hydrolase [Agromyces flavus]MCP2367107.1 purine nucleosidase/pyrimidine-specific ribonucleoside hydrolase [Agromyces flavus]GGI46386.1 ribosylpyrimidine nucleosidase [Agromyces flavus]SDT33404.1 pyrimidine-specific ribonucleoside hydrolase [Agromyces flavus]
MSIPVIVDCDPGHDDVMALWLAAGHPALELLAVTTVGGNVPLRHTSRNARVALAVAGVEGVPVSAGAAGPLARELSTAEWIHGENGLGGPELPDPDEGPTPVRLDPRSATELIADTLLAASEPVAIVATGPITNVAVFLRDRPELADRVREIVWMGGSTERGNVTPYAEFNAWVDPEALDLVLRSGVRFTMVGLNVTHRALVTTLVRERLAAVGNRTAAFGDELLEFFCRTNDEVFGMPDGPLHDPVAVAVLADPEAVEVVHTRLDVELGGTETVGATSVDLDDMLAREPNAHVAVGLDVERFWAGVELAYGRLA